MRVGKNGVAAAEVLAEEAHAKEEDLPAAGATSPPVGLVGADGQLGVPVAVERALVDVGAPRQDVRVVHNLPREGERITAVCSNWRGAG